MTAALVDGRNSDRLRALNDKFAHGLWCYVVRVNGGDRVKAQDVVQETLLRAWRNGAVLEQADGSQRGWLFTVARHIVIDEWRSSRSAPALSVARGMQEVGADMPSSQPRVGRQGPRGWFTA
jgi:RNA polymerase sigma-70 factor (ECF subfamily)